jgi:hypothetical protein
MKLGDEITLRILEVDGPVVLCINVRDTEQTVVLIPKHKPKTTYRDRQWRSIEKKIKALMRNPWI